MFVMRQINSRINSTSRSFAVICLLLFFAITIFSFGFGMNAAIEKSMENDMPYDVIVYSDQNVDIADTLAQNGLDLDDYTDDYAEHSVYQKEGLVNGSILDEAKLDQRVVNVKMDSPAALIRLSDYNRQMAMQGKEGIRLQNGQVAIQSSANKTVTDMLKKFIKGERTIEINKESYDIYPAVLSEGLTVSIGDDVIALIVPDAVTKNLPSSLEMLYFNCKGDSKAMQVQLSERIKALQDTEDFPVLAITESEMRESYVASKAMIAYVGIYLGIIFLITSAAILALQQLSEMADNRRRYAVIKKIGADDKMTGRAILKQTAIYFLLPLALACVHSVVGIWAINSAIESIGSVDAFSSSFITATIIVVVYGAYFLATYWGSRNLIQKSERSI